MAPTHTIFNCRLFYTGFSIQITWLGISGSLPFLQWRGLGTRLCIFSHHTTSGNNQWDQAEQIRSKTLKPTNTNVWLLPACGGRDILTFIANWAAAVKDIYSCTNHLQLLLDWASVFNSLLEIYSRDQQDNSLQDYVEASLVVAPSSKPNKPLIIINFNMPRHASL